MMSVSPEATAAFNLIATVGATAAWLFFMVIWLREILGVNQGTSRPAAFMSGIIAGGMFFTAARFAYWQPYYVYIALGDQESARWFLNHQGYSTLLSLAAGTFYAMHLRCWLERYFGRRWLLVIVAALSTIALGHYASLSKFG